MDEHDMEQADREMRDKLRGAWVNDDMVMDALSARKAEPGERPGMIAALTAANLWREEYLQPALDAYRHGYFGPEGSMRRALACVLMLDEERGIQDAVQAAGDEHLIRVSSPAGDLAAKRSTGSYVHVTAEHCPDPGTAVTIRSADSEFFGGIVTGDTDSLGRRLIRLLPDAGEGTDHAETDALPLLRPGARMSPRVPGYNTDRIDIAAGLKLAGEWGWQSRTDEMVITYALQRHARGEEEGAVGTARKHGIDLTSWYAILAAARAAGEAKAGPFCGAPMAHSDQSVSPCILPAAHLQDDSDHEDEHGHRAPVLVSLSTIREVEAVQREREAADGITRTTDGHFHSHDLGTHRFWHDHNGGGPEHRHTESGRTEFRTPAEAAPASYAVQAGELMGFMTALSSELRTYADFPGQNVPAFLRSVAGRVDAELQAQRARPIR